MPIYAYRCAACGHTRDVLQKMSDAPLTVCPACGAEQFSKQVTAAGFQLKGSGWYVTDFRNNSNAGKGGAAKPAEGATPAASGSGESSGGSGTSGSGSGSGDAGGGTGSGGSGGGGSSPPASGSGGTGGGTGGGSGGSSSASAACH
jgi:putative FmdB family regulatory protein